LNENEGSRRAERGPRRKDQIEPGTGGGDTNRYFINIGTIDGVTRADLLHFIADVSGVDRKAIGNISLQKNCAYFDIDSTRDKGLANKFRGMRIEGRKIRVNPDTDTKRPKRGKARPRPGLPESGYKKQKGRKGRKKGKGKKRL
ncbi:MAG TPA: DbpA RNA binding domain-containing protein, partial [Desulfobacterales bacterium]|nr:DbpA RNA binding domain-containing protein [Desulfobacterales bacterium]